MKKVLVFGTFDGLHEGHKNFFKQAKEFSAQGGSALGGGDNYLVVVVGRDSTIVKTKGRPPKFGEQERLKAVSRLICDINTGSRMPNHSASGQECLVDEARLGNENMSPYVVVKEVNPDIICLGYDQTHFTEKLTAALQEMSLGHIQIKRLNAFEPEKYKSSILNK